MRNDGINNRQFYKILVWDTIPLSETKLIFMSGWLYVWGVWWCNWLRHYATSQKPVGSISDEVLNFSTDQILSATLWPLGSTQPVTKLSTRNIPGGKRQPVGT
jgi:hypothetical protein